MPFRLLRFCALRQEQQFVDQRIRGKGHGDEYWKEAARLITEHEPIRIAEQWATLDLLSKGRVDFAAGRGYDRREYLPFGVSFDDNQSISAFRRSIPNWKTLACVAEPQSQNVHWNGQPRLVCHGSLRSRRENAGLWRALVPMARHPL